MPLRRRGFSSAGAVVLSAAFGLLLVFAFASKASALYNKCIDAEYDPDVLQNPCSDAMKQQAPEAYSITFPTNYFGNFTAHCVRNRAPLWADRIWNMARFGYYNNNYFFRVIPQKYVQFGTNGHAAVSNVYNWSTTTSSQECAILHPQPPQMPYCMADNTSGNCSNVPGLSNTFGTLSMSTSYNVSQEYPQGVTWNATAELFINIGDNNTHLDQHLFVPICTISHDDMHDVVLHFPSFGEVAELGGSGPSLGLLYQDGNAYIESNATWKAEMAQSSSPVKVCHDVDRNDDNRSRADSRIEL